MSDRLTEFQCLEVTRRYLLDGESTAEISEAMSIPFDLAKFALARRYIDVNDTGKCRLFSTVESRGYASILEFFTNNWRMSIPHLSRQLNTADLKSITLNRYYDIVLELVAEEL